MVPPDSLLQELTVPNLQIARELSCVVFIGFVSSGVTQAVAITHTTFAGFAPGRSLRYERCVQCVRILRKRSGCRA